MIYGCSTPKLDTITEFTKQTHQNNVANAILVYWLDCEGLHDVKQIPPGSNIVLN